MEINFGDLLILGKIGTGSFSFVYEAMYNNERVAVKIFKKKTKRDMFFFEKEKNILIDIDHPNVVKLLAYGYKPSPFIVFEYIENGTLKQFIKNRKHEQQYRMSDENILDLALKIAEVMKHVQYHTYDSQHIVIHRDLKPENIGFSKGMVKILDFGLSRMFTRSKYSIRRTFKMSGETGTFRYMAPEVIKCKNYNEKIDVYSFGLIIWELLTGNKPYKNYSLEEFIENVAENHERPIIPNDVSPKLRELLCLAWHPNINVRPSFDNVISFIKNDNQQHVAVLLQMVKSYFYNTDRNI